MSRLPAPYGECVPDITIENYIYQNYVYSVEVKSFLNVFQPNIFRAVIDPVSNQWF